MGNYANHSLMVLIKVSWSCTLTDVCRAVSDKRVCVRVSVCVYVCACESNVTTSPLTQWCPRGKTSIFLC